MSFRAISIWRNARSLKNGVKTHWHPLKWGFFEVGKKGIIDIFGW